MLLSESNREWEPVPKWAAFLIQLGYRWSDGASGRRKIALVSMPCDSAAAGLITLGAVIRDLENPNANDVDGHYDSLLRFARQYLDFCRTCQMRCHPEARGCGHTEEVNGRVRNSQRPHIIYHVSDSTDFSDRRVAFVGRRGAIHKPSSSEAIKYYIDREPAPEIRDGAGSLPEDPYSYIVEGAQLISENLRRSYSGLCFAGRVGGEKASREALSSIRLRVGDREHGLPDLLAVHGWSQANVVSRVNYYNTRTSEFTRRSSAPALVVADGDASFLKVLGKSDFQSSDVVGVVPLTVERGPLEAVGNRMAGLRQWYGEDREVLGRLPALPRGINMVIVRKRSP